ncbi:MAG: 30S ribosomal protein S8 [Patescibacteria group bacterium]|jgi:small subunit ribosomal protein S8
MISDPIADMLTIVRNALMARKKNVHIPHSKMREKLCHILVKEKYLESCTVTEEESRKTLDIQLRYTEDGRPAITTIRRISKPGRRVYVGRRELPVVINNFGIAILSTPQGLMTNREARKTSTGGEIICEIY